MRALLVNQEYKSIISLRTELQGKAEQIYMGDDSWSRGGAEENWVMDTVYHEIPLQWMLDCKTFQLRLFFLLCVEYHITVSNRDFSWGS